MSAMSGQVGGTDKVVVTTMNSFDKNLHVWPVKTVVYYHISWGSKDEFQQKSW
jgi:hypothetical protein